MKSFLPGSFSLSKVERHGRAWPPHLATPCPAALMPSEGKEKMGSVSQACGDRNNDLLSSDLAHPDPKLFLGPRPVYKALGGAVRTGWASC